MAFTNFRLLKLCDVKLRSEDGSSFDVHKTVLAMKSEYFCHMFCGTDGDGREFTIPGISGSCLSEVLKYIYNGEICVTEDNIADVMVAGDYLLVKGLYLQIKQSVSKSITVANSLNLFNTACRLKDDFVSRSSFRFIETKFEEIMRSQTSDLADLPQEVLEKILSSRSLYVYSEATVWQVIKEWVQKDISVRSHCVPQLLMYLAARELDDNLATEIMEHRLVSKNSFMQDLNEINDSPDFKSNLETLVQFLEERFSRFKHLGSYRIPPHLYAACSYNREEGNEDYLICSLLVTYDENIDLWRQIGRSEGTCIRGAFLIVVGHNLYLIGSMNRYTCQKFDLIAQQWVPMSSYETDFLPCFRVVAVDGYIYIIGDVISFLGVGSVKMETYDAANDRWFDGGCLSSVAARDNLTIYQPIPVTLNRKIYVVGKSRSRSLVAMTAMVFDTLTHTWTLLPQPRNAYGERETFSAAAYRGEVHIIGYDDARKKGKVDVLNPETNLWRELPDLPCTSPCNTAVVLKDQLIVYDGKYGTGEPEGFRWNDVSERWEEVEVRISRRDLRNHRFSIVDDENAIRHIMKENRDPRIHLEKSMFG